MLEKFLSLLHGNDTPSKMASHFDHEKLKMLVSHFPIGRKLHYYPEYLREATLETIIIGYRLNDQFIYANEDILRNEEQEVTGFRLAGNKLLRPDDLEKIFLLLPDTSEQERNLDYITRAELGPAGQFRHGNIITLVAESAVRCTPTLDTTVSRRLVLKDGPYTNDAAILIEPDLTSLAVVDKRKQQRIQAALDAGLFYGKDASKLFRCKLHDFSESSLCLVSDPGHAMPPLQVNDRVFVEFAFAAAESAYRFSGKVQRIDDTTCVVRTEQLCADGNFRKIQLMDVVEIKTRLLNNTR